MQRQWAGSKVLFMQRPEGNEGMSCVNLGEEMSRQREQWVQMSWARMCPGVFCEEQGGSKAGVEWTTGGGVVG